MLYINDLEDAWKPIKKAFDLPAIAANSNCNLNANSSHNYFANVGPKIKATDMNTSRNSGTISNILIWLNTHII